MLKGDIMKITAHDLFTGNSLELTATLTIDHYASSYGQPVMIIEEWENNDVMSHQNWVLAGCQILEISEEEKPNFKKWYNLLEPILP